ncbi:MAG: ion channel [Vicinamibacterales bacterium]
MDQRPDLLHARFGFVLLLQFGLLFWLVAFDRGRELRVLLELTGVIIPLFAIAFVTQRKRDRRVVFALAAGAMFFSGGALSGLRPGGGNIGPLLAVVFSTFATWRMLVGIVRSERVTGNVLAGALATYIMAGLAFAVVYGVIAVRRPDAFVTTVAAPATFSDLVYFSFVTLLTIGFGDVTPAAPIARAVVLVEGLFGVAFTTVVMASLVAGYLRHRENDTAG